MTLFLALLSQSVQAGSSSPLEPQPPTLLFNIAAKPIAEALIDYAVQANVSLDLPPGIAQSSAIGSLKGYYTPREGLRRLLAGTGYTFKTPDAKTIVVLAAPKAEEAMSEIIVTATKLPTRLDRIAESITVLSASENYATGPAGIQEIAGQLAGVTVTNLGPGEDKIFVRGISDGALTGSTQSTVGIYLDDSRLTYNAPDPDLKLADISRVEILRGPQGTLYGAGSVGGIYRIVSQKPDLARYSGAVTVGASATMHGDPSAQGTVILNLPVLKERLAVRLVGYAEQWGGYIDDNAGPSNVNSVIRRGGRATAALKLGDSWDVSIGLVDQNIDSRDSQYVSFLSNRLRRTIGSREPSENDFLHGFATVNGDWGWAAFTSTTAFVRHEIDSRYDATALTQKSFGDLSGLGVFDHVRTTELWSEEARLTSLPESTTRWFGGIFLSRGAERQNALLTDLPASSRPLIDYRELREDQILEVALFGELYVPISRTVTIGAGLRWHLSSVDTDSSILQPVNNLGRRFAGNLAARGFSPKLVLNYRPIQNLTLYAQASEGYRVGGFNTAGLVGEAFVTSDNSVQPGQRYGKDELWNFEIGSHLSLLKSALSLRMALFWGVWNNVQSDRLLPSGLLYTANLGDARTLGFEAEANYHKGGFAVRAHVSLNDAELIHPDSTLPFRPPRQLPDIPHFTAGLAFAYAHDLGNGYFSELGIEADYVGASSLGFGIVGSPPMGDYANARLHASIGHKPWRLTIFVENPADIRGNTFSYGNPFTVRTDPQLTPLRPRIAGFSLSASF